MSFPNRSLKSAVRKPEARPLNCHSAKEWTHVPKVSVDVRLTVEVEPGAGPLELEATIAAEGGRLLDEQHRRVEALFGDHREPPARSPAGSSTSPRPCQRARHLPRQRRSPPVRGRPPTPPALERQDADHLQLGGRKASEPRGATKNEKVGDALEPPGRQPSPRPSNPAHERPVAYRVGIGGGVSRLLLPPEPAGSVWRPFSDRCSITGP